MQDDTWSWVGEDGVEHHGSESQLAAALSAQHLAAYTLVTKASWRDWLPAMAVAEFQWALPVVSRDVLRNPTPRTHEPKLPPPLHEYPALRLRHQGLYQAATPLPSRPRSSIPSSPHLELARYANDEFDEPTVQIDAEELERALNESRVDDAPVATPRSGIQVDSATGNDGMPLVNHDVKRRALAQRLAHKMPTYPGYSVNAHASSPPGPVPASLSLHGSAPPPPPVPRSAPSWPAMTSAPVTPPSVPSAPVPPLAGLGADSSPRNAPPPPFQVANTDTASFGANEPTLTSRIGDGEARSSGRKLWLALVALSGTVAGVAWFATQNVGTEADAGTGAVPSASAPVKLPTPIGETQPPIPLCTVEKQLQLSEFAHAQVRPVVTSLGQSKVAVGFAQTGRVASGISLDSETLSINRPFSDNQTSPLWSVTPVLAGSDVKFRVSRAASTLRSTVTLTTDPPLFFGLNRDGFAVRGDADLIDRVVWKAEWDTISMPDVAALDSAVTLVALRAGGERGKILLGKVSARGDAVGELTAIATGTTRVEPPSLLITDEQVLVTYAAGDKPVRDKVFVAASNRASLPSTPKEVLRAEQGVVAPTVARAGRVFVLQYTRGSAGKQEVVTTVLNPALEPQGEPLVVSPVGRDAYEGVIVSEGSALLSLYFVRQEFGHELWTSKLICK